MLVQFPPRARIVQDSIALGQMQLCLRLRVVRTVLAFICVTSVLLVNGAGFWTWTIFIATSLGWPWMARAWALRSRDHGLSEVHSLLIDSALGGVWIAIMQFNLLPSVLLMVMPASDVVIAGRWNLLLRGLLVQAAACVLTLAIHGFAFMPQTSILQMLVTLPVLIGYPLAVSICAWNLPEKRESEICLSMPTMTADEATRV